MNLPVIFILTLTAAVFMPETVSALDAMESPGSPPALARWVPRSWTTGDGLPQNSVNAVLQTSDGFLWAGTNAGLARFDGVRFRSFGLHEGLRSVRIMALAEDRQGSLWAGTSGGGLSRWENGRITSFGVEEGFPSGLDVIALSADEDGSLWIGTNQGLVRWHAGTFEAIGEAQGLPQKQIRALLRDSKGTLWVSVILEGLYRRQSGRFVRESWPDGVPSGVYSLMESRDGSIWAGCGSGALWQRRDGAWKQLGTADGLPKANLEALAQDGDGTIWIGTRGSGLYRSVGARFEPVTHDAEFFTLNVRSLTVDREGSVWAGITGGGLKRLSPRVLEDWGPESGLPESMISSVTEDASGSLWAGTANQGVYRFHGGRFNKAGDPDASRNYPFIYCTTAAPDGSVWAAGEQCLYLFHPDGPAKVFLEEPVKGRAVRALCADGAILWAGTYDSALLKHDVNGLQVVAPSGTFPGGITSIVCEAPDTLWVGTSEGLHRWERGQVQTWTTRDGLLTASIFSLHRDPDGTLWLGTLGGGLARMKDGRFVHITTRQGLVDDVISQIVADDSGNLWLGSNRGIMRIEREELGDFAAGRIRAVHPVVFGRNEGMRAEQCAGGYSPTVCKTKDGRLLFPTVRGIVEIDPRRLRNVAAAAPRAGIEGVLVDNQPQPPDSALSIPPGKHRIEVSFTAPVLHGGEWVRFRHRLEGFDNGWVMAGSHRLASYDGLPPGRYVFHVAAADGKGNWNEPAANLAFTVQPLFWQTLWFRVGGVLLLAGASGAAAWWHLRRKHRRQLAELEQERRMQAEMTHLSRVSSLAQLSGSLAHELNQPLGIILSNAQAAQRMLGQQNPDLTELREILTDIVDEDRRAGEVIKRLRALLKRGETRLSSVSPNGIIEDVLRLLRSDLMGRGVTVQTAFADALPTVRGDEVQLQQVLINILTNAGDAMEGNSPEDRILRISTSLCEGKVRFSVEDQGCGLPEGDASCIFQPFMTTKSQGMGIGLSICQSIIAGHHGRLWAEPNPGRGTTFHLELPVTPPPSL
ncbi:MAG: two-component regulator propeller domain-containing protein [Verrucomicrobiota bacterium]